MEQNSPLETVSKSGISLVHATVHRSKQVSEEVNISWLYRQIDILVMLYPITLGHQGHCKPF